jgi:hypothetical protein
MARNIPEIREEMERRWVWQRIVRGLWVLILGGIW